MSTSIGREGHVGFLIVLAVILVWPSVRDANWLGKVIAKYRCEVPYRKIEIAENRPRDCDL